MHVVGENHLALHQQVYYLVQTVGILAKQVLSALILLVDDASDFLVNDSCALVAIGLVAHLPLRVVVGDVRHLVAHAVVHHHATRDASSLLHIVECAGSYLAQEQFLGGAASHEGTNLVEECLLGHAHALLGGVQIDTQRLSARHN